MRRDYFTLATSVPSGPTDDPVRPTLGIRIDGPSAELTASLTDDAGEPLPADAVDVTCRLRSVDEESTCVVGVTHRLTGEFLLEVNGAADDILDLVDAARSTDDEEASYRVSVETADGEEFVFDKETLLVYDEEGSLLRQHSLIPSGVEL